jgi:DNA-directed RNA polymerase subunit M
MFCEKCGNLMFPEKKGKKLAYICRKCGHTSSSKKIKITDISEKLGIEGKKVLVMEEDEAFKQYPKTKIMCPKCDHNEAYWYMQQTRGGDEPPTRFYCCTKCGHKWREYS